MTRLSVSLEDLHSKEKLMNGWSRKAVALFVVFGVVGGFMVQLALMEPKGGGETVISASETAEAAESDQAPPASELNVVDNSGVVRGQLVGDIVTLPSGHEATAVSDREGNVVGYLVRGHVGFVDLALAEDAEELLALDDCFSEFVANQDELSDDCEARLSGVGVVFR